MGYYAYKSVVHRPDFQAELKRKQAEDGEFGDFDPAGYDGDYWIVAANLLNKKDARIARLESRLSDLGIDFE